MIIPREDPAIGFASQPLAGGEWSWTLTLYLGALLRKAEAQFGPRDLVYTILGIEFGGDVPCIWYPGDCRQVSLRLSENARMEPDRAYFQLAHEVVHLLAPKGYAGAPVIEEGLATMYSHDRSREKGIAFVSDLPSYL